MIAALRRGACPSLAAPMRTGDGWLARLTFTEGMTGAQLAGLAEASRRLGNGMMEVTARGSLQLRGLAEGAPLAAALAPLGLPLAEGLPVATSPLAGLDPAERADPRPLAGVLRRFVGALPPKAAAVVDGGGAFALDAVSADLRLLRVDGGWQVGVGGTAGSARWLGVQDAEGALACAIALLGRMARERRRGRDLADIVEAPLAAAARPAPRAAARFRLRDGLARSVAFPFGLAESPAVAALAEAAGGARLCPAPGRALVAVGLTPAAEASFVAAAARLGFVTEPEDPRLAVAACAGAPACGSGRLATRAIAARIAAELAAGRAEPARGATLHLSGCPKRCAQPAGPAVSLVAEATGPRVTGDGRAAAPELERYLREAATW